MIIRFRVDERLPAPARSAVQIVQTALKASRKVAVELLHTGAVTCNGKVITQSHIHFAPGDQIEIDHVPPSANPSVGRTKATKVRFCVIHDDPYLIVVNKPAGILTVPSPQRERNTLKSQIDKWLLKNGGEGPSICVQRLDRGVSGVLVFAKDQETGGLLREQFAKRKPSRKYAAIVAGCPAAHSGTFESYLTTDSVTLGRYSVQNPDEGQLAITHYQVREQWGDVSLCEVTLETGRRNQIRVHFAEAGHPVLGDPRYEVERAKHPQWPHKRIALHAEQLGFRHPRGGKRLEFTIPWPQEFRDLRRRLKNRPS